MMLLLNTALSVGGATTMDSTLTVEGLSTFNGRVDVCGNFYAQYPVASIPASALAGGASVDADTDISLNAYLSVGSDVSFNADLQLGGNMGINTEANSDIVLDISSSNAIRLPKGENADRPVQNGASATYKGLIRYNSEQDQFEGFGAGNAWGSLGGVKDVDQDTYIIAETSAGDDNDQLQFYTAGTERLVIDATGDASFNNGLNEGVANMESTLVVNGDLSLNADMALAGNLVMDGTLQVRESQSIINTTINNYEVIITNDLSLNGNMVVSGDASFNNDIEVSGDILPTTANSSNIGSADKPFGALYVSNNTIIHFVGDDNDNTGQLSLTDGEFGFKRASDAAFRNVLTATTAGKVGVGKGKRSQDATVEMDVSGSMAVSDNLEVNTMTINSTLTVSGDIVPTTGNVINLGSADKPFGGLYVSNNTIHFAGTDSGALSFQEGGLKIQSGEGEEEQTQDLLAVSDGKVAIGKASSLASTNLDVSGTMVVTDDVSFNSDVVIHGDLCANYVYASIPNSALEEPFYHVEYTPIGGIIIWNNAQTDKPAGYTICDGRTVNDITTPDLRGKFVIGYDASNNYLNQTDNSGGNFIIENDDLPAYQYQFENEDINNYILGGTPVIDASYAMPYYVMVYIMRTSNVITDVAALQRNSDISLNFHLAVGRSTTLRSTLDVSGATTFNSTFEVDGATTFNSILDVSDNVTFDSDLAVHGDVSLNSILDVSDNATFNSQLTVHGDVSLNSILDVSDNATFKSDLILHGDASMNSNLFVGGDLSLNGDLSIQGNLSVFQTTDTVTINTTVNNYEVIVTNDMSLNGNMVVSGATSVGSTLDISGATILDSTLGVTNGASLASTLDVSGATILDSTLGVTNGASLASTLDVSGATILDSTLGVTNGASLASTLDVSGATILDSTLVVNGDVSFNSSRVDICGNFYAVYPDNSIPAAAIIGDVGGGGMSSSSILAQF